MGLRLRLQVPSAPQTPTCWRLIYPKPQQTRRTRSFLVHFGQTCFRASLSQSTARRLHLTCERSDEPQCRTQHLARRRRHKRDNEQKLIYGTLYSYLMSRPLHHPSILRFQELPSNLRKMSLYWSPTLPPPARCWPTVPGFGFPATRS